MTTYKIHDNGGRPFLVEIIDKTVNVYKELTNNVYSEKPIKTFIANQIFIGTSPLNNMTRFSGGHGKKFDGNSILLFLKDDKYVFIGWNIFSFRSFAKIVKYDSPVGNSDVPYPYAIDEDDNYYLMIEDVVIKNENHGDPYRYFYDCPVVSTKSFKSYKEIVKRDF